MKLAFAQNALHIPQPTHTWNIWSIPVNSK